MPNHIQPVVRSQDQSPFWLLAAVTPSLPLLSQASSEVTAPTPVSPVQDMSSSLSSFAAPSMVGLAPPSSPLLPTTRGSTNQLQDSPAAFVAGMIASQASVATSMAAQRVENNLLHTGLNPPAPFPLYSGPSSPEVQVCGNACPNNASPAQHISPFIHPDDPQPWDLNIWQKDIAAMEHQFEPIGLVVDIVVHDGVVNFLHFHQAIVHHQARPDTPKIPGFNVNVNTSYRDCGWCLQQIHLVKGRSQLRCCERAHTSAMYWCLRTLATNASMFKASIEHGEVANPALKNVFIILPTNRNITHSIEKCYQGDFSTPISLNSYEGNNERCLRLCRGEDPNLIPSLSNVACPKTCPSDSCVGHSDTNRTQVPAQPSRMMTASSSAASLASSTSMSNSGAGLNANNTSSTQPASDEAMVIDDDDEENKNPQVESQQFIPTHHLQRPLPFRSLEWESPGRDILAAIRRDASWYDLLVLEVKDVKEAVDMFWQLLLHLGKLLCTLPEGKDIDPLIHPGPTLLPNAVVCNWWMSVSFLKGEVHPHDIGMGDSLYIAVLSTNLTHIFDTTGADCVFVRLPNNSQWLVPRFPIYDLTPEQQGFWWALGFLIALFSSKTGQPCLPIAAPFFHVLLPSDLSQCWTQIDRWSPLFINSVDLEIGELMLPWLALDKTQSVTDPTNTSDCLLEAVPMFLLAHCVDVVTLGLDPAMPPSMTIIIAPYVQTSYLGTCFSMPFPPSKPCTLDFTNTSEPPSTDVLKCRHCAHGYMQASMILDACDCKDRTTLEFAYHFFNNKLHRVSQLMCHFDFDITAIEGTEQGHVCFSGDKNLTQLVQTRFRGRLEEYLKADIVCHGAELLTAMTASPYLPADPDKKLKYGKSERPFSDYLYAWMLILHQYRIQRCFGCIGGHWHLARHNSRLVDAQPCKWESTRDLFQCIPFEPGKAYGRGANAGHFANVYRRNGSYKIWKVPTYVQAPLPGTLLPACISPLEAKNHRWSNESTTKAGRLTGINDSAEGAGCPFLKEMAAIVGPASDLSLALGVALVMAVNETDIKSNGGNPTLSGKTTFSRMTMEVDQNLWECRNRNSTSHAMPRQPIAPECVFPGSNIQHPQG
ncbi:hypothetical protein F5146DRAFT_999288 [Armillaria mellea]|nr:hypothetical protein F5146DRAFT_999288 [Armillaria mellea]